MKLNKSMCIFHTRAPAHIKIQYLWNERNKKKTKTLAYITYEKIHNRHF